MNGIPPGTICMAWGFKKNSGELLIYTEKKRFKGSAKKICDDVVAYVLKKLVTYHHQALSG